MAQARRWGREERAEATGAGWGLCRQGESEGLPGGGDLEGTAERRAEQAALASRAPAVQWPARGTQGSWPPGSFQQGAVPGQHPERGPGLCGTLSLCYLPSVGLGVSVVESVCRPLPRFPLQGQAAVRAMVTQPLPRALWSPLASLLPTRPGAPAHLARVTLPDTGPPMAVIRGSLPPARLCSCVRGSRA